MKCLVLLGCLVLGACKTADDNASNAQSTRVEGASYQFLCEQASYTGNNRLYFPRYAVVEKMNLQEAQVKLCQAKRSDCLLTVDLTRDPTDDPEANPKFLATQYEPDPTGANGRNIDYTVVFSYIMSKGQAGTMIFSKSGMPLDAPSAVEYSCQ